MRLPRAKPETEFISYIPKQKGVLQYLKKKTYYYSQDKVRSCLVKTK